MKKYLTIIVLGTWAIYCQAEEKTLSSAIKAVTLYNDRAAITRSAEITLPAGQHSLIFTNLPHQFDTNSLQVNAQGSVTSTILDITTQQQLKTQNPNQRLQTVDEQIKKLQDELANLADQETLLNNQKRFIDKMQAGTLTIGKDGSRPTADELRRILTFSKDTLTQVLTHQRTLSEKREALNKQLSVLQNDRYPLLREQNYAIKNVVVRVNLEQAGALQLDLNYVTYGASWYPNYDARFDTKERKVTVNYQGVIQQQTGEDWQNVKLTLSTAKPAIGGTPPTLGHWIVDEYKDIPMASSAPMMMETASLSMVADADSTMGSGSLRQKNYAATQPQAVLDTHVASASFTIKKSTSLPSNGSQQKVAITTINLPSTLQYTAVPRLQQLAYLQAQTTNSSDYPLLAGKLNVFMNGRFVTTSQLKTTMPKEEFKLDLGADEGMAVTYKLIKRYTEKKGFTSSTERITYEYQISVQNNKSSTEMIEVVDRYPVSQNEKITVTLLEPTQKDKTVKIEQTGKLIWNWTLKPSEKQQANLKFYVDYPVNTQVSGLQ